MTAPARADWRPRLARVIEAANLSPWAWGYHDCLAFAAKIVEAVTGDDLFAPFRGRYSDEAGAGALVPDLAAFMAGTAAREGWEEISHPNAAPDGSLALFDHGVPMVGVIYTRLLFPKRPSGLKSVSRTFAVKVWRIGGDYG